MKVAMFINGTKLGLKNTFQVSSIPLQNFFYISEQKRFRTGITLILIISDILTHFETLDISMMYANWSTKQQYFHFAHWLWMEAKLHSRGTCLLQFAVHQRTYELYKLLLLLQYQNIRHSKNEKLYQVFSDCFKLVALYCNINQKNVQQQSSWQNA